jgi:hypothetical protein
MNNTQVRAAISVQYFIILFNTSITLLNHFFISHWYNVGFFLAVSDHFIAVQFPQGTSSVVSTFKVISLSAA